MAEVLLRFHNQSTSKDKDIVTLRDTNSKLQEHLKMSTTELDGLSRKIEDNNLLEADRLINEQKYKLLENNMKIAQEHLEKLELEHNLEKSGLLNTISQYEHLNHEILEKNNMIEQTKTFITNISSENMALRSQVEVRELTNNHEQLLYYQSQYYQILNENQRLLDQQEILKADNKATKEHQDMNYKHLQKQLQDLKKEHQTVISLQNERKKYLEEKDLLRTIFHHLKSEISRVQKLEGTVSDISKEANKLAMIAEYNKELGKKLKSEIIEKDKTFLKDNKDKLSLCYELSEICQIKDQLNSILSKEVEKNVALDNSKKEVVQSASSQMRKYQDSQKRERSVLKDILKDLKMVVKQRDALATEREDFSKEIAELKMSLNRLQNKYEDEKTKVDKLQENHRWIFQIQRKCQTTRNTNNTAT
ncbi:hypothetical protein JTB14_034323 [Gonioctena quinquepunctata]|nr:hypothetical protein JTB14_034323 [Gonioctena quinquepunctata]